MTGQTLGHYRIESIRQRNGAWERPRTCIISTPPGERFCLSAFGFSLARHKAVFPLRELTGNIWMARVERQQ